LSIHIAELSFRVNRIHQRLEALRRGCSHRFGGSVLVVPRTILTCSQVAQERRAETYRSELGFSRWGPRRLTARRPTRSSPQKSAASWCAPALVERRRNTQSAALSTVMPTTNPRPHHQLRV